MIPEAGRGAPTPRGAGGHACASRWTIAAAWPTPSSYPTRGRGQHAASWRVRSRSTRGARRDGRARDDRQRLGLPLPRLQRAARDAWDKAQIHEAHRPRRNGKVERMNRALAREWQYARLWAPLSTVTSGTAHTARAGVCPPMSRIVGVNNVLAHNT